MGCSRTFRFGPYEADVRAGELRKDDLRIQLRDKSFEVLVCLLEHPGELVTREELRRRLWPEGVFVEFDNSLNSAVNRLRGALRDRARKPRYIETVSRHGYRFLAPVDQVESSKRQTLAVLPFANLNSVPEMDYFADGITDALITELGRISSLRVISRQSTVHLKGSAKSMPEIAGELGAHAVVEGSVLHAGDRVRITAQLLHTDPEEHVWAQSYERRMSHILDIQREIARAIAERVQVVLTPENRDRLSRPQPVDPRAYEAFLKGGFYLGRVSKEGFQKAFEFLGQATALDPEFAPAWATIGLCYSLLGFWGHVPPNEAGAKAIEATSKALQLDESLALAHGVRGWIAFYYEWDFPRCERELDRSLELNCSEWQAYSTMAVFQFIVRGDVRAGIAFTREMLQLDPLSLHTNANAAWFFVFARDFERACEHAHHCIDMFPEALHAWYALGQAKLGMGCFGEAIHAFERAVTISRDAISLGYLGSALGRAGRTAEAEALLGELRERSTREYVSPKSFITLYAGLGDVDHAYEWIEEAFRRRDSTVVFLDVVPIFDPLRGDSRFGEMLQRVGLPPS
jgi:TolB-like protein